MTNPYKNLKDHCYWSRSISRCPVDDVDPVVNPTILLSPTDKIATAGSCFAQHIARHLSAKKFNFHVVEEAHPLIPEVVAKSYNYGLFSARYGNVYTARQLLQLLNRAFGDIECTNEIWSINGRYVDPYRPLIQPNGYSSLIELQIDRNRHLNLVKKMFQEIDVFVFTLGLTQAWVSKVDGTVFPICPGVSGGDFSHDRYELVNFTVAECINDMESFINKLKIINPNIKVILTVSPVPLAATALNEHVLVSTTYSKSVLRVCADHLANKYENVDYFPSYEIITGNYNRGQYFANDLRSVTESGVNHVMKLFFKHYAKNVVHNEPDRGEGCNFDFNKVQENLVKVNCDETLYDA